MPSGGAVDISFTRPASAPSRPAPLVVPKAATNLPYGRVCDPINAVIEVPPLLHRQGNAAWRGRATTSMTVSMSNGFPRVWRRCWLLFSNRDKYNPNKRCFARTSLEIGFSQNVLHLHAQGPSDRSWAAVSAQANQDCVPTLDDCATFHEECRWWLSNCCSGALGHCTLHQQGMNFKKKKRGEFVRNTTTSE